MNIGIIGYGVVGKSVHNMLSVDHAVSIYDPALGYNDWTSIVDVDVMFICVPTPTVKGVQDLSIMHDTLSRLKASETCALIVIKSTTLPSAMRVLCYGPEYEELNIMHAPESLDQHTPYFYHTKHLIGVKDIYQSALYREVFGLGGYGDHDVRTCDPVTAAMIKYVHNCHGAIKVAMFNEFYEVCEKEGVNYREMLGGLFAFSEHIDKTYTQMASDGQRGFGGVCFPKDLVAFDTQYNMDIAAAAIEKNMEWRKKDMDKVLE